MRKLTQFLMMVTLGLFLAGNSMAQITTSGMNGKVTGPDGNALIGATVVAIHVPTGTQFGGISDGEGFFRLPNMDVGGPYTLKVTYVGNESWSKNGIYLTLGQTYKINPGLKSTAVNLGEVSVIGQRGNVDIFDGNRTGSETVISMDKMDAMPTVGRDMTDFTRLTPQATIDDNSAISIAGVNNRYNSLTIDGGYQNDAFGLAASGVNGGQTGGTPISMDAIEQFQVTIAPYDVRYSGFAGAGINAVTRRGTNKFQGSIYSFYRDQNLSGMTPLNAINGADEMTDEEIAEERKKLADFTAQTTGFRLGGPIIKNKLHFFVNGEMQRDKTPQPFDMGNYNGNATADDLNALSDYVMNTFGYETGSFDANTRELKSDKFLARLDWNINTTHKLMFRHSYTNHESLSPRRSSSSSINYYNNGVYFPSKTNSSTLELKSNFDNMSNDLIAVFTTVRDDRDPLGANFPAVRIYDGSGTIYMGSEPYSTANGLNQNIFTLTDNFSIYKGKHTITFGTSNEFAGVYNLFMRKNYGEYRFYSMQDFYDNKPAQFERGYSLVDNITGDGSAAAADFQMLQLGLYAQDEFQATDDLKLTFGLRADMPIFLTAPGEDTHFNETTIPMLEEAGWDMMGAKAGQMPSSQVLLSPRIGFNWDVKGDETTQLRGGVGVFTSRLPLVWPGGSYTNNGLTIGGVYVKSSWGYDIVFTGDWENQYENTDFGMEDAIPSGQMDLFSSDFKYPQMFRANLGLDQKLAWGMVGTVEGIFTKTINNVNYYNLNVSPDSEFNLTGADTRAFYSDQSIDPTYGRIMVGTNTNEGYAYNFSVILEKPFENGFTANLAYSFGRSMALNDGTSSQNSSQWKYMEQVNGLNNLSLSYSDFDQGHRFITFLSYRKEYFNHAATQISLFYNGSSGDRFSYVYNDYGDMNGEGQNSGNLIYVPASQSDIVFADAETADAQWEGLNTYIENDAYLSGHRGEYAERNGARTPFQNIIDLKIAQDFFITAGGTRHKLQLTMDIFNLGNMLNSDWGRRWYVGSDSFRLIKFKGFADDGTTPTFEYQEPRGTWNADDSGLRSSRWMAQLGVRYAF
ncbi:MAG: TonB-dependent receptor [Bacteroidales bacterium]|nr:TonB-dependent receptor [Bacteroidales bacterium]